MDARIDSFMDELRSRGRACPADWSTFQHVLSGFQKPGGAKPPVPMILAASAEAPSSKHRRLKQQLLWAEAHHCLDEALSFLEALPDDGWEVSSEQGWNKDNYPSW